jgi:hypothetical protein
MLRIKKRIIIVTRCIFFIADYYIPFAIRIAPGITPSRLILRLRSGSSKKGITVSKDTETTLEIKRNELHGE